MTKLFDGTIVPSHMNLSYSSERIDESGNLYFNRGVQVGYVVGAHYAGEQGYTEANDVLYDVISYTNSNGGSYAWQYYFRVRWAGSLGGSTNDFSRMSIHTPKGFRPGMKIDEMFLKQCSAVLLGFDSGRITQPHIIGFAAHPLAPVVSKDLGHFYRFDFNGMSQVINKDGELSFTFNGSILDPVGNTYIQPPDATKGTTLKFTKEGGLLLDDVGGESILLDKKNKQIGIIARKMVTNITEDNYELSVKKKALILAQDNAVVNGSKVFIGREGSSEPLVKGNALAAALDDLVNAFLNAPLIGQAGPLPVRIHPSLVVLLKAWVQLNRPKVAPFLSKRGFIE